MTRGKVIADMRSDSNHVGCVRIKLLPAKDLAEQLPIASIPMVRSHNIAQHDSVMKGSQPPVVRVLAHQHFHAKTRSKGDAQFLCSLHKTLAYTRFPNGSWGRVARD